MKDRFSTGSEQYLKYRPRYPRELFDVLQENVISRGRAWDCGTGNGQVAEQLAHIFREVCATDISKEQLGQAVRKDNIGYSRQPAEETDFPDHHFDLITVAQAIHWFDFDRFYREAKRVLRPDGAIAVVGYGLLRGNDSLNEVIDRFYREIIGPYWDEERHYLEEKYETIPFPFREIETPDMNSIVEWDLEHLVGYLNTWSAVKHYKKVRNENPLDLVWEELRENFGTRHKIVFPIYLRMGVKCL